MSQVRREISSAHEERCHPCMSTFHSHEDHELRLSDAINDKNGSYAVR